MTDASIPSTPAEFEIPGHLSVVPGQGGLLKAIVTTKWSTAEIYLHGAHVTAFQKNGEAPLLFLSRESQFTGGTAIRGGVPIIFPWFGSREGMPAHGHARTTLWNLAGSSKNADDSISLRFQLPPGSFSLWRVEYVVTVAAALSLELIVENDSEETLSCETCLHSYFSIGRIEEISVSGLQGCSYIDQLDGNAAKIEESETVSFSREVDRIYTDSPCSVEIIDPSLGRKIQITTSECHSTVVWNPWVDKSRRMADFGDEEYLQMVCVESGNVAKNGFSLAPQQIKHSKVTLESLILQ